jgi:hypothetical protein
MATSAQIAAWMAEVERRWHAARAQEALRDYQLVERRLRAEKLKASGASPDA